MDSRLQAHPTLVSRLLRGAALTGGSFVLAQAMRFGSNLIVARLLFPDAFGLMALVTMILFGLTMLSDAGVQQSIMQNARGDDQDFLNTAFTLNAARGVVLWGLACALAWPAAMLYDAPELALVLPVCAVSLLLSGLAPTKVFTSERHIRLGRVMMTQLASQAAGILVMIVLAWATGSYWAMVWGMVATAVARLALEWAIIPGQTNRLRWERDAARDLLRFGGWIMMSSGFGFLLAQGDRAILGYFFSLTELGLYNIAWFLAAFPVLLMQAMNERMLIPAYRESFDTQGSQNTEKLQRMRYMLTATVMAMLAVMALAGPFLIGLLYDDRYLMAGPMIVLISCAQLPPLISATYQHAALARGEARLFFRLTAFRAIIQSALFLAGFLLMDLPGALAGQALAAVLVYPAVVRLAAHTGVWDKRHDLVFSIAALCIIALALFVNGDLLIALL
ncbi:oligosaccharide flippase family protein [Roseinatronobacter alkalisoli]|uniref:Oligosaccharide flippase family protein n=1 Tax=Roseinatronobacter alkalisoli TaxID=3028235 RepID=A0ABT5T4X6_9RHOB|nr:oligosaccharide flippase family protein [Roseinatronobacter sp. HJB301]MDD7970166.1 oligosaccharide flippase family protein [Roseinatronobacter sp. HJB301]